MNIGLSLRKLSPGTPGHVGGRRLFKDEAAASITRFGGFHPPTWEAHPGRSGRWMEICGRIVIFGDVDGWLNEGVVALVADNRAEWAHIARHDPGRVLQDVESGRRVLEWAHTLTAPLADRIAVVAALAYRSKSGPLRPAGGGAVRQLRLHAKMKPPSPESGLAQARSRGEHHPGSWLGTSDANSSYDPE